MKTVGIIPARMASSRFPGKPMKEILGMPMIGHCYLRSKLCTMLDGVYVATCDKEIADYVGSISGKSVMTTDSHERASDRTAEALLKIETITKNKVNIVVMIQGDEPMILPEMIEVAVRLLLDDPAVQVSNLMAKLKSKEEWKEPNEVKVVVDNDNFALYFSREPIPSNKKFDGRITAYKQVCIIPFTRDSLFTYIELEPTPLEIIESVDMNRFLEHGIKVKMVLTKHKTYAVDTPLDLSNVERLMSSDSLVKSYLY